MNRLLLVVGLLLGLVGSLASPVSAATVRVVDPSIKSVTQSSTGWGGVVEKAFDGNRDGRYRRGSVSHTSGGDTSPSMTVVFKEPRDLDSVVVWNRTDRGAADRLNGVQISVSSTEATCGARGFQATQPIVANRSTKRVEVPIPRLAGGVRTVCLEKDGRFMSFAEIEFVDRDAPAQSIWTNVASGGAATQSSTSFGGVPSRAIDGNRNGAHRNRSVAHTRRQANAWWQVDLGASHNVENVRIFNRTDCCADRLSQFYVLASETPIPDTYPAAVDAEGVTAMYVAKMPALADASDFGIDLGGTPARYIKIIGLQTQFLSLAEVEVWAEQRDACTSSPCQIASSSSNAPGSRADLAIDGNPDGNVANGSVFSTAPGDTERWWNLRFEAPVDLRGLGFNYTDNNPSADLTYASRVYVSATADNACLDPNAQSVEVEPLDPFSGPPEGLDGDLDLSVVVPGASIVGDNQGGTWTPNPAVKSVCIKKTDTYGGALTFAEVSVLRGEAYWD